MAKGYDQSWRDFVPPAASAAPASEPKRKRHKYSAEPVVVDGIRFDSTKEAERWQQLQLLEKAGQIHALQRQRPFTLSTVSKRDGLERPIGEIVIDFVYRDVDEQLVVEDVKSEVTKEIPLYKWKRKHFETQYGLTIREV